MEGLINIDTLLRRCLDELAAKVLCKVPSLCAMSIRASRRQLLERRTVHANLALIFKIALVGDDDDREGVLVFHSQDLLVELANFLERVPGSYGVHKQETLSCPHVLLTHRPVSTFNDERTRVRTTDNDLPIFFLASSVEDIQKGYLIVNDALFTV